MSLRTDDVLPDRRETHLERVHYAEGVLLDAHDFRDEQLYHRARLSRALELLHQKGTVSGLKVELENPRPGEDPAQQHLLVQPGVAIDGAGRIIEVPAAWCLPVQAWLEAQVETEVTRSRETHGDGLVADVFLSFAECERSRTPAFAAAGIQSLDATVPHRLRDAFRLDLILRPEVVGVPKVPFAERRDQTPAEVKLAILKHEFEPQRPGELEGVDEEVLADSALFLARVSIGTAPVDGALPIAIDNEERLFVYSTALLSRWVEKTLPDGV